MSETKNKPAYEQPTWVCIDCGKKHGTWWHAGAYAGPVNHATYHVGQCTVCGKEDFCTEPRDFGYLKNSWQSKVTD
jgi:hypothetical protein